MSDIMGEKARSKSEENTHSAEEFAKFFANKVESVRQSTAATPPHDVLHTATHFIDEWKSVTPSDVEKMVGSALNKTCQLDPAPTWLIKEFRGLLSPFIALLFNKSLATGCLPTKFKHALVFPLLKKSN